MRVVLVVPSSVANVVSVSLLLAGSWIHCSLLPLHKLALMYTSYAIAPDTFYQRSTIILPPFHLCPLHYV